MIKIGVKVEGLEAVRARLNGMARQIPFAAKQAVNEVARKVVQEENAEISRVFKGPVPRTANATKLFKGATKEDMSAIVGIDDGGGNRKGARLPSKGVISPAKYLLPQIIGGTRVQKRFERALQSIGAMPPGAAAVYAKRSNALDQYGNLPGPKIVQIISYFRHTKAEGYGGKMSDRSKENLMQGRRKGMKWGMAYFRGGKGTGLPDGIWERHYPNGTAEKSFIRPILIYVSGVSYQRRFMFAEIAERVVAKEWQPALRKHLNIAISTAR